MKLASGKGSEDRKKIAAVVGFVLIASALFYFEYFYTGAPATPAPVAAPVPAASANNAAPAGNPPSGAAAKPLGTTSAALDPTLHMEAMLVTESLEYSGSGRNIFSASSAPVVTIPNPITAARPKPGPAPVVVPCPPNCPPPPPPPPPPPIDLKFFGVETAADGTRQAFLLHDDSVFLASAGDVVLRRYRVVSIEAKSVRVEDMQYNNTQTLPLLTN
ncbi:MAG: hypothetical protein ABSE27_03945 [Acidobacteriaceae bacterium]|jgi:hypothetical protein